MYALSGDHPCSLLRTSNGIWSFFSALCVAFFVYSHLLWDPQIAQYLRSFTSSPTSEFSHSSAFMFVCVCGHNFYRMLFSSTCRGVHQPDRKNLLLKFCRNAALFLLLLLIVVMSPNHLYDLGAPPQPSWKQEAILLGKITPSWRSFVGMHPQEFI